MFVIGLAKKRDRSLPARAPRKGELRPSPKADRYALARRLALDLTGLPPAIAEVDQFVADSSPGAYEKLVDRVLARPSFGNIGPPCGSTWPAMPTRRAT